MSEERTGDDDIDEEGSLRYEVDTLRAQVRRDEFNLWGTFIVATASFTGVLLYSSGASLGHRWWSVLLFIPASWIAAVPTLLLCVLVGWVVRSAADSWSRRRPSTFAD